MHPTDLSDDRLTTLDGTPPPDDLMLARAGRSGRLIRPWRVPPEAALPRAVMPVPTRASDLLEA